MRPNTRDVSSRGNVRSPAPRRRERAVRMDIPPGRAGPEVHTADPASDRAGLERFAAMAAHELLEPLVMTEACTTTVLRRHGADLDPECRADLEALASGAGRTRAVVDALLNAALWAERRPAREEVDLGTVVHDALSLLRVEVARRRARIEVEQLPVVAGNRALLGAVVKNLLANALRYGPRDGGTIRMGAARVAGAWRISMSSQGPPIPAEDRLRIFEPFERGRMERRATGVGLGLAICGLIVERQGGVMGVEPLPHGNRFYFSIPA
jgi:signal transduction histidine kinase